MAITRQSGRKQSGRRQSGRKQSGRNQTNKARTQNKRRGTKKMNKFIMEKEKARKANRQEFQYNGNTYVRGTVSTGMVIYRKK